jgi:signal peptidase I
MVDERYGGDLPTRGDMVVFRNPHTPSAAPFLKRVVGLPGDRVQLRQGQLYINGQLCPRQSDGDFTADNNGVPIVLRRYRETLPNGLQHAIVKATDEGYTDNTPEYLVPAGSLFALDDNRDNSLDSRFVNFGFVPVENLIGKAWTVYW